MQIFNCSSLHIYKNSGQERTVKDKVKEEESAN